MAIHYIFAVTDTLINRKEHRAYELAAQEFTRHFRDIAHDEALQGLLKYDECMRRNPQECRDVLTAVFAEHVTRRKGFGEVETHRSILARFLAIAKELGYEFSGEMQRAARMAETAYWASVTESSRPYPDVAAFIARTTDLSAPIIPIARTDVHVTTLNWMRYDTAASRQFTEDRVRRVLGTFTADVIVFEECPPTSRQAWDENLMSIPPEDRCDAAFVGCSREDMRMAEAAGCRIRILVDRANHITRRPPEATELVRSLHAAADLLQE